MNHDHRHDSPYGGPCLEPRAPRERGTEVQKRLRLRRAITRLGRGFSVSVNCPAHDDERPSLRVTRTDQNMLLFHCHAGCSTEDVLRAARLPLDTLASESDVEGTYVYQSAEGTPLARLTRRAGKRFIWERAVGDSWSPGLDGVVLPIYRLPEIQAAITRDEAVFLVEGEKCADSLEAVGLHATTTPNGAKGWKPRFAEYFEHAHHILILPDNDEPGRAYAAAAQNALRGAGRTVQVISLPGLPPKGDVVDFFEAGHSLNDLLEAIERASTASEPGMPQYGDVTDLLKKEFPTPRAVVRGLLTQGLFLLAGPPKIGKSFWALQVARDVTEGRDAFGFLPVSKCRVLFFALEDSERRLKNRLEMLGATPERGAFLHRHSLPGLEQGGYEELEAALDADSGIGLVVIDTLGKVLPAAGRNGNAYLHDVRHVGRLQEIFLRRNVCLLAVHCLAKIRFPG